MTQQEIQPHNDVLVVPQQNEAFQQNAQDDGKEHASKWALFVIVAIGIFMAALNSSIVKNSVGSNHSTANAQTAAPCRMHL